eukprot:CAMPEP_0115044012 /NCGR_PEP_ID=MMETSP0216-20121206/47211_1 /TAXON_ID=223996 /ORGANISM="Protocruzia adherens, Strain Boccale" /LENGTH=592 /DNA_ID=CAMNT_0002426443 /DNA_START=121 /DNA_END=1896 /DNA_ORIENTATION=+
MMSFLGVFIVYGAIVDYVFIFLKNWNGALEFEFMNNHLQNRWSETFWRTMSLLSIFLLVSSLRILPIAGFGFLTFTLLLTNYIFLSTFLPACLILLEGGCATQNSRRKSGKLSPTANAQYGSLQMTFGVHRRSFDDSNISSDRIASESSDEGVDQIGQGIITKDEITLTSVTPTPVVLERDVEKTKKFKKAPPSLMESWLARASESAIGFVYRARYLLVVAFFFLFGLAIPLAMSMEPLDRSDSWFVKGHEIQTARTALEDSFPQDQRTGQFRIKLIYGIKGLDRSDIYPMDPTMVGEVVWDYTFNLAEKASQERMLEMCSQLLTNPKVKDGIIQCFMRDFKNWCDQNEYRFPVTPSLFDERLKEFLGSPVGKFHANSHSVGYVNNHLSYAQLEFITEFEEIDPEAYNSNWKSQWQQWENFMKEMNKNSPAGLSNGFQSSDYWQYLVTRHALELNSFWGVIMSFVIAFCLIMYMVNLDVILSGIALIPIIGTVTCDYASAAMLGWQLGFAMSFTPIVGVITNLVLIIEVLRRYPPKETREDSFDPVKDFMSNISSQNLSASTFFFLSAAIVFTPSLVVYQNFTLMMVIDAVW